jgi:DNA primase
MMVNNKQHPASRAVPILEVAAALGLDITGRTVRCPNGSAHKNGEDRHPSMCLYPDTGRFKCFACDVHGDAIDLVRLVKPDFSFKQAVAWLQDLAKGRQSSTLSPYRTPPLCPALGRSTAPVSAGAVLEVLSALMELAAPPRLNTPAGVYLHGRGIDPRLAADHGARELVDASQVCQVLAKKFSADALADSGLFSRHNHFLLARHPLLFFYLDEGRPVFVQGRAIEESITPKEMRPIRLRCPVPYNRDLLREPANNVYVCEGCIDTLSAIQFGWPAVGVPGVQAFDPAWFSLFRGSDLITICFDNDNAGRTGALELRSQFRRRGFRANIQHPKLGKDINDCLRTLQEENLHAVPA